MILSLHDELVYAPRALRAGALGYVMKEEATETLLRAIRKVLDGGVYLSPRLEAHVKEQVLRGNVALHPLETLSDRELEVFRLIGRGVSNRDISKLLVIRLKTVESHRTHIKQKLHLGHRKRTRAVRDRTPDNAVARSRFVSPPWRRRQT